MECLWVVVKEGRDQIWESQVLGLLFLVLGLILLLVEAGYDALRDRRPTRRTRSYRISPGWRRGMSGLIPAKTFR
ncbi:MAG: hypothetical protein JO172_08260 [Hyphomicrobiales bacterium]|nr:hypothetical protein [Hyphomicrobiales bacterium]